MHEFSIATSLIDQVRAALPEGAALVAVRVEVGALEHVEPEVLMSLWEMLAGEAGLAGARLDVDRTPLAVRCGGCGRDYDPPDPGFLVCPHCGQARPEILAGSGVLLRSIEVDVPDDGEKGV